MDHIFPFNLPGPTAFYLVLYVLTFALHQALVHYVLAGSVLVAGATVVSGVGVAGGPDRRTPTTMLRDWMPLVLSAAITAGVAPLLFVQVLFQQQFYTANILLAWRWLAVIPVLVAAFYLLYVMKSKMIMRWPWLVRNAITIVTAASIVLVGFCWTANYLVSTSQAQWPEVYATGQLPFSAPGVLLRMLVWGGGAFASMSVIVGWQLAGPATSVPDQAASARTLAAVSVAGLLVALAGGIAYLTQAQPILRSQLTGPAGLPYLVAAAAGVVIQSSGWIVQWSRAVLSRAWLSLVTIGWLASLVSVSALREVAHWTSLATTALVARHAEAREISGFGLFLAFAVVNFAVIAGCVWAVRRAK